MKKRAIILLLVPILTFTVIGAMGQGGLSPLVNSTHTYSVTPGNSTNAMAWSITGGPAAGYTINSGATTSSASVTWKLAGTYTIQFQETSANNCITLVSSNIIVGTNTFDVFVPSNLASVCSSASNVPNAPAIATTQLSFTVNMVSGYVAWNPNWEFAFSLLPGSGASISNVAASSGTLSGIGPFILSGATSAAGVGSVTITLDVTGSATAVQTVILGITSAKELQYQTAESNNNNNEATLTINAIPTTTGINAN